MPDRPVFGSNFLVDLGTGDPRGAAAGFSEVVFPTFRLASGDAQAPPQEHLVLRRGTTGNLDLYAWWHKARRGKAPQRRTVKVMLLDDDHDTVVMTWRFRNVRPVALSYSPLDAANPSVLVETLELDFDSVEMS